MDQKHQEIIMSHGEIQKTIEAFAGQIHETYPDLGRVAIVGIQTGGAHLARRLVRELESRSGIAVSLGILDITLYRDDLDSDKGHPIIRKTDIPFKVSGKIIVLVDDVLYTGRTVRAALDALIDFGRPRAILLAVIIDRGLREFPIRPDFVGKNIATSEKQRVLVRLVEESADGDVVILEMGD